MCVFSPMGNRLVAPYVLSDGIVKCSSSLNIIIPFSWIIQHGPSFISWLTTDLTPTSSSSWLLFCRSINHGYATVPFWFCDTVNHIKLLQRIWKVDLKSILSARTAHRLRNPKSFQSFIYPVVRKRNSFSRRLSWQWNGISVTAFFSSVIETDGLFRDKERLQVHLLSVRK